uniref:Uncharacterized protein n=1 Tax=Sipha flava TaxID=143950 RepID=A0A2S2QDA5_9HEMI
MHAEIFHGYVKNRRPCTSRSSVIGRQTLLCYYFCYIVCISLRGEYEKTQQCGNYVDNHTNRTYSDGLAYRIESRWKNVPITKTTLNRTRSYDVVNTCTSTQVHQQKRFI